eukprot:TRINITY_DN48796_c0_g1_i1.p1 TRINITY_DN48796_c0_g1~~TRINITY_DN48796_c0_g1_i1.p1  ORF type:complete len:198 (-),score=15.25 TRINITY_DN48796_c0_g1_i1:90-683(-)
MDPFCVACVVSEADKKAGSLGCVQGAWQMFCFLPRRPAVKRRLGSQLALRRQASEAKASWESSDLVLPRQYSQRLLCSSFGSLMDAIAAAYAQYPVLAVTSFVVWLCSINYWRRPNRRSPRRQIDMLAALVALVSHLVICVRSSNFVAYLFTVALCISCYLRARQIGSKDHNSSSWCHVALHVVGSVGNLWMYAGLP